MSPRTAGALRGRSGFVPQVADVGDNGLKLFIVEAPAEGRHARRLAGLDAGDDEVVRLIRAGELRPPPGDAAAALMAPAAGGGEDLRAIEAAGRAVRWPRDFHGGGEGRH